MGSGKVSDRMTRKIVTLRQDEPLREAVELALVRRIRHVPVVDETGALVGILTDSDVKRALPTVLAGPGAAEYEEIIDETPISRLMTKDPVTVAPDADVTEAVEKMLAKKIRGVPVVEDGRLIGIFTQTDALKGYLELLIVAVPAEG